jgi:hypothetical protein
MKRGWITWDHDELTPERFTSRLEALRARAREKDWSALIVYTDVGRSNDARHLVNFMPYFNRALLAVPATGDPVLVCGLSPRVYPWIRSVTVLEDIRPGKRPVERLMELAKEKGWMRIGAVDLDKIPHELYRGLVAADIDVVPLDPLEKDDDSEIAMRQKALGITRPHVEAIGKGKHTTDHAIVAELERTLRGAGMEDLVIRLSDGDGVPRPARGAALGEQSSVLVAAEYRGHWISIARPLKGPDRSSSFEGCLDGFDAADGKPFFHDLSGPHPFQAIPDGTRLSEGRVIALTLRYSNGALYGETCHVLGPKRAAIL